MGQAVVDLPDPMDAPPPTSMAGTDDLLAQLAGDEIDRLLAEAEEDRANAPPGSLPAPAVPPSEIPDATAQQVGLDPVPVSPPAPPTTQSSSAVRSPTSSPAAADDELDTLLNDLNQSAVDGKRDGAAPTTVASVDGAPGVESADRQKTLTEQVLEVLAQFADGTPAAGDTQVSASAGPAPAPEPAESLMSTAERDALGLSDLAAETTAAEQQDAAAAAAAVAEQESVPSRLAAPAIRLLEWINAPLRFVPDALRDTLGKVALVTVVNSIAVLIYVLFLRH